MAELDASGNVVARFVYATRPNVPAYLLKGGQIYRIIGDHLGSPRLVVNASTGQVAQRLDYDEFGSVVQDTSPGFQPFGFAGGLYDPETGLLRFGARDYDPVMGRWTTQDPALFTGATNLHSYVDSDPINALDIIGKDGIFVHFDYYPIDTGMGFTAPLGHAGVVSVNPKTGETRYYEYGRYGTPFGRVERKKIPDLVIGEDGKPTAASMKRLLDHLSEKIGKQANVSYRYFEDADHERINAYAERLRQDKGRDPYSVLFNNCKSFAADAIRQAR